ncbi:MAG: DUF488 domain-containing protein [Phycisphaeraceae bacterium]
MKRIRLYTIGFTKKSAEQFFTKLAEAGVKRIVDVRLNNSSQLAAFAKRDDLAFFLKGLYGIEYVHAPQLAPTQPMLDDYKKKGGDWEEYERAFLDLMAERSIEKHTAAELLDEGCLLCSEHEATHCHRRLVAEYLHRHWGGIETTHLI